jgi:hypothetical protein
MAGLLLPQTGALADSRQMRSSFPGRRIGGGTRGECTSRLLVHLVPVNSVYAPGTPALLGVLEGPALQPSPLELSFRPYRQEGMAMPREGLWKRDLPASSAGITLLEAGSIGAPMVWESHYRCEAKETSGDPLDFTVTTAPPVVSLLLGEGTTPAEEAKVRLGLLRLRERCGAVVPRSEVAATFGLEDLLGRGWPEQLPVRCPQAATIWAE